MRKADPAWAHEVLAWRDQDGNRNDIEVRLRAHAILWRNGSTPEHAAYCEEAANEIYRLRNMLEDIAEKAVAYRTKPTE